MQTLRFSVNGEDLDMGNARVSYKRNNPMFETIGSHTLPFKILRNPHNEQILKSYKAAFISPVKRINAIQHIGPVQLRGEFVIIITNDLFYEGHFTTGNSTFREKVRDVKLNELEYTEVIPGSGSVSFTDALTAAAYSSYPTHNYTCFPFLAPDYYNDDPWAFNEIINPWSYHPTDPNLVGFYPSNVLSLDLLYAPSFYLCFVIQKVFSKYGYAIEINELLDDSELKTLTIPNFNTLGEVDTTYKQYDLSFANALPPVKINDFISYIEEMFNLTFFISELTNTVNIKKNTPIVKSNQSKVLKLISREQELEDSMDGFNLSYTMDSEDEFSKISSIEGHTIAATVDNKEDFEVTHGGPGASLWKNQLIKISNNDLYYLSKLTDESTNTWEWVQYTKDYFDYKEGNGDLKISTGANPVLTDNDYIYDYYSGTLPEFALFPRVEIPYINSESFEEYKTFSSLRLLFYRGVLPGGGRHTDPTIVESVYPLATPDVYKAQGAAASTYGRTKISAANQSLRWDGQYGLYETHYKDYLYWYLNLRKSATDIYELSLPEIFSIEFWNKYQAGDVSVLFRSMEIELDYGKDTVTAGKCEVYLS